MPQNRKTLTTISDGFIADVCQRLAQGKRVRRTLPLDGRLHIDRILPFLCVYRRPTGHPDKGTDQLVKGEASYLLATGNRKFKHTLSMLVQGIVETIVAEYGAFLIIEIWAGEENFVDSGDDLSPPRPRLRVIASKSRLPTVTIEALTNGLKTIKLLKRQALVEVVYEKRQWPEELTPLLSLSDAKRLNCFMIGLEVKPIYRDPQSGKAYPLMLRRLHRTLASAIKRSVFEFSHQQTSLRPASYQALGKRALVKAVWEVDRGLAEIDDAFDFLLQVTPVNIDPAWNRFKRGRFDRAPAFLYRPSPVDPELLKRELYKIPVERIEDPTLSLLFREKRTELDQELSMLRDRGKRDFLYGSLQLFGNVSDELTRLARDVLQKIPPHSREGSGTRKINAREFAKRAEKEIEYYRTRCPEISSRIQIRDDTTGLMVSKGNLLVGQRVQIPESRVEALLHHELGTHVLTYVNGQAQPFQQLHTGLAGYDELQEGLAVIAEYLVGGLSRPRLRVLAGRVIAIRSLITGATFIDTFRELNRIYGFEQQTSYSIAARVFRGGGLTKDAVYLRGLVRALKYLREGGELEFLFIGKIAARHIPVIRELQAREVLRPIPLRPRYLDDPQARERLARLQNGVSVLDLVERRKK